MASPSHPNEDGSEENCVISCNLKYGISETFNQYVTREQNLKAFKTNVPPQIFNDPIDQSKYSHMMKDVMFKTFDDESEKKIFRKALEGMVSNYPEILNGTEKHMFYCPTAFHFDSRIGANETSAPDALDEMRVSLEAKQSLTQSEKANLKIIQNHIRKLRPQLAEQEFFDGFACFFYQHLINN